MRADASQSLDPQIAEVDGHADIWRLFYDAALLRRIVRALAGPFDGKGIDRVAGIESRGFLLGGAVAVQLGAGFAAIRKQGHFPGPKLVRRATSPDYRGIVQELRLQARSIRRGDRVLLVDDWIEMGSQASVARSLIEAAGGRFIGTSVVVNQLPEDRLRLFGDLHCLVRRPSKEDSNRPA